MLFRSEACVAADAAALATVHVRDAVDLGALALADSESLASLLPAPREGLGPPAWLTTDPGVPLADLGPMQARPERIFQGAPGALTDRAAGRAALLDVLRAADKGDLTGAVNRARALDQLPGGDQSLAPLLAPHLERARIAQAQGRKDGLTSPAWQQAESALATAAAIAPENASVRCLEGDLAMDQGQLVRAQTAFEACARLDPDSLEAQTGLARARGALGNTAGAELALRTAAAAHPEVWTAAHNLGVWLLDAGRYDEAEPLLKQAAANQAKKGGPLSSAPYLALARLYLATARPQLALAQAQRAVTTEESATGLALRGAARYELGTMDAAESDFRAALAKNPDEVLALGGLGQIHATRGEYDLAAKQFTAVLQRDPRNAAARANLERQIGRAHV